MKNAARIIVTGAALATTIGFAAEADRRQWAEQARVAQGVRSGALTPRESARIERQEAAIRAQVNTMRAVNGGRLTPAQRVRVDREEDRVSREIYNQKHDAQRR